ncbi:MAG TPA: hypothetical protein VMU24_11635 [Candidatus Acidoferrales bacterium]|nr:hypothetical protein [Candidatus Acidoferrales bacterium]
MARRLSGFRSAPLLAIAIVAALATITLAQPPALVPQATPFSPPDTQAPPPRATAPGQQQPPAQSVPAQSPPILQTAAPASQGIATAAPAPLLQKPAVQPVVTMQNGLLSIDASNSNLSDVLAAVHRATGAVIDGAGSASERVVVHLGPGRPNEVISSLLNGSRYDYVLLGSAQQPGAVTRVMLSVRQGGDQFPTPQAASNVPPANAGDDEGGQDDTPEQREQDVRQAEPPAGAPPQGNQPQGQPGQPQYAPTQPSGQNNDQPKTPQQLFEEIQRMQQQRQQGQQPDQQAPPPPNY